MKCLNVSYMDIMNGNHPKPNKEWMLISITDPSVSSPLGKYFDEFESIKHYSFHDVDNNDEHKDGIVLISDDIANSIAKDLEYAFDNKLNVLVHCMAGLCRSGAVVEAAGLIGFEIPDIKDVNRLPNTLVYNKVRKSLNVFFSWESDSMTECMDFVNNNVDELSIMPLHIEPRYTTDIKGNITIQSFDIIPKKGN